MSPGKRNAHIYVDLISGMPIEEMNVLGERVILENRGLNPTSIDYLLL